MEITVRAHARGERAPDYALVVLEVGFESARLEEAHRAAQALASQLSDDLADARRDHSEGFGTTVISPVSTRSWRPWHNDGKQLPIRYAPQDEQQIDLTPRPLDVEVVVEARFRAS